MFRKFIVNLLVSTLFLSFIGVPSVAAKSKEEKAAEFAAKMKTEIAKLGVGTDARIEIKLRDKTKLKGYVSKVGEESFAITDPNTGTETNVPYPNVTKATGKNTRIGKGTTITLLVVAGVLIGLLVYFRTEGRNTF